MTRPTHDTAVPGMPVRWTTLGQTQRGVIMCEPYLDECWDEVRVEVVATGGRYQVPLDRLSIDRDALAVLQRAVEAVPAVREVA